MTLDEKIQKKAEGFGKLAPTFIEGAYFVLNNQWISIEEDLPCNHDDKKETKTVLSIINGYIMMSRMYKQKHKWYWETDEPTHWFPIPELPK